MRKYRVIDADGEEYEIEETINEDACHDEDEEVIEKKEEFHDEPEALPLEADEIDALKRLAAVADKLIALLNTSDEDMDEEELHDEDEEEIEAEEEEEVIDTDEQPEEKIHDSKSSFGAIERKKKQVEDSSLRDEVADAWTKRYGGIK